MGVALGTFFDFSVIWGAKMGDCLQVHVLGDPGMEMMTTCGGCMCLNNTKHTFLSDFTFSTYSLILCLEG